MCVCMNVCMCVWCAAQLTEEILRTKLQELRVKVPKSGGESMGG